MAKSTKAVIIDHDIVKTAMLQSLHGDMDYHKVIQRSKKPMHVDYIQVDTSEPKETYIDDVLAYINSP